MASYVVMEPPARGGGRGETRFIRDGFVLLGLLFPVIWLLWHRLWIEAVIALAVLMSISVVGELSGWTLTAMLVSFLASLYVGLDGPVLRLWALRRRGWRELGIIDAASEDEAMTRYFGAAGPAEEYGEEEEGPPAGYVATPRSGSGPALGLLSYPSGR